MNAVTAAIREANGKQHEGAAYRLNLAMVNGDDIVGSVADYDDTHVVITAEEGTAYVTSAHVVYAQIEWLP